MGVIKSAFEKAMEKAAQIGELTPEEKQKIKEDESLKTILADFYKGKLGRDELWQTLKGGSEAFLKKAQMHLADSLGLGGLPEDFQIRREGILAIETLKKTQNTSSIELILDAAGMLRKEYQDGKERAAEELREAVERNPQLRMRPVKTPDGRTALQAAYTVDEAVQVRMAEFLAEHEEHYGTEFDKMLEKLIKEIQ